MLLLYCFDVLTRMLARHRETSLLTTGRSACRIAEQLHSAILLVILHTINLENLLTPSQHRHSGSICVIGILIMCLIPGSCGERAVAEKRVWLRARPTNNLL